MTRALTWVNFVWDQALIRYVQRLHLKLVSRRVSHGILALVLAVTIGGMYTSTTYAADAAAVGGLGISVAACALMGPACVALILVVTIVAAIIYLIVQLLFQINLLLSWIVIEAASYNNFVNAKAVELGWTLIRDVVNMFFIVVLLILAFSTIIGYKQLHYKDYLPKLLLMAVLINFSRTLVGVLIDFSQVLTLTFVNGFKQAAGGNFAKAFGITNMLKAASNMKSLGDAGTILISLVFALVILTISTTTLTILMIYFIVRIVYLWVLLILSPAAFFVTALPAKMKKGLSQLDTEWWSKLSGWLTGGPIVAFFLWLSLAVVQSGTNEFSNIASAQSQSGSEAVAISTTEMGKPENVGLLIISVALMLIGVQTAVTVAQQTGSTFLAGAAQRIKAEGGPAGFLVRRAGRAAGRAAAPRAAAFAGGASKGLQGLATKVGKLPVVGGIAAGALTARAGQLKGFQKGVGAAANKRVEGTLEGLSTGEQLGSIDAMLSGKAQLMGSDTRAALERKRAMLMTKGDGQKAIAKQEEDAVRAEFLRANRGAPLTKAQENQVKAKAADQAKSRVQGYLSQAKTSGETSGDEDLVKNIDEAYKKNPSLYAKGTDVQKAVNDVETKEIAADALRDLMVDAAILAKHNLVDPSGNLLPEDEIYKNEAIKKMVEGGGDRAKYFKAAVQHFSGAGKGDFDKLTTALQTDSNPGGSRMHMSKSSDGTQMLFGHRDASPEARAPMSMASLIGAKRNVGSIDELTSKVPATLKGSATSAMASLGARPEQFREPLNTAQASALVDVAGAYSGPPNATRILDAQRDSLAAGIPTAIATNYNETAGTYGNMASRLGHEENLTTALTNVDSADPAIQSKSINTIANTDVELIKKGGQMRDVLVKALNSDATKIKTMLSNATDEQGKKLQSMIGELSKQVSAAKNRGGAFTPGEQELVKLESNLGGGKAMRSMAGGGTP